MAAPTQSSMTWTKASETVPSVVHRLGAAASPVSFLEMQNLQPRPNEWQSPLNGEKKIPRRSVCILKFKLLPEAPPRQKN